MKIVHVASELFPYVKTGGLADAVGSLVKTLAEHGHEVAAFLPGYRAIMEHPAAATAVRKLRLRIEMGDQFYTGEVRAFSPHPRLTVYLICRDEWFDRRGLYGNGERDYEDNFHRFLYFQKGVVETLRLLGGVADVVHCHDWQTGLLPLLLRHTERRLRTSIATTTIFTVHNIAFQGVFPLRSFYRTNLPQEFRGIEGIEYYGQMSMMKGGLLFADKITTVSPHYAEEIQSATYGCGMEGIIATRAEDLHGLLNGIDTSVWSPTIDPLIPARYHAQDMSGKSICRTELLKQFGLTADGHTPILGMVCRLTEQKGLELLLANQEFFLRQNVILIVLGTGEKRFEDALRQLSNAAPGKIALSSRHDEPMSHLIEAGSDFFLMPSVFEPCGLNQMYSQCYGTPPLASAVGGLWDTVIDADAAPDKGTGITFPANKQGLLDWLNRALRLFQQSERYHAVQKRGMLKDFSWGSAVAAYERLYQDSL